jgi:hypothetical protein
LHIPSNHRLIPNRVGFHDYCMSSNERKRELDCLKACLSNGRNCRVQLVASSHAF